MTPEASGAHRRSPLLTFAFTAAAISAVLTFGQILLVAAAFVGALGVGASLMPVVVGVALLPQIVAVAALMGLWRYRAATPTSVARQQASRTIVLMVSPALTIFLFVAAGVARALWV